MKAIKKAKKAVKKTGGKVSKKATKQVKKAAQGAGKVEAKWKKFIAQKDDLIKKLKGQLADKQGVLREGEKTVREAMGKAQEEISTIKEKTDQTLMEWKGKAEAEYKRLKEELEKKAQPWGDKVKELEEYKKKAEKKFAEMQARAKESVARAVTGPEERHGLFPGKDQDHQLGSLPGHAGLRHGDPALQRGGGQDAGQRGGSDREHGPSLCAETVVRRSGRG
jgi:uncharacterized protein YukE